MDSLSNYKKNITSQWGEDGIIEEIVRRIGKTDFGTCVEFGAWDGKHMSNTYNLWHNKGWSAILIEGNAERHAELKEATKEYPGVLPYHAFVEETGENSLDTILKKLNYQEIDLLSIDIDGNDYYILKSLHTKPRILVIEYNPTIPPHLSVVSGKNEYFGSSAKAIVELAKEKGYSLVAITETNCIFVTDGDFSKLNIPEIVLNEAFPKKHLTYIMSSYDGTTFINQIVPYSKTKKVKRKNQIHFIDQKNLISVSIKNKLSNKEKVTKILFSLKNGFRKIPGLMLFYKEIISLIAVQKWKSIGMPVPAPHRIKEKIVIEYSKYSNAQNLVETGTYMGEMIDATKKHFIKIISIELDKTLALKAQKKFADNKKVTILQGDSGLLLPTVLKTLSGKTIFWLDAHYSGGITAKGSEYTPIISEVKTISSYPQGDIVLLVDDARLFIGKDEYPLLSDFKKLVTKLFPKHEFEIKNDVIRIYRKKPLLNEA